VQPLKRSEDQQAVCIITHTWACSVGSVGCLDSATVKTGSLGELLHPGGTVIPQWDPVGVMWVGVVPLTSDHRVL